MNGTNPGGDAHLDLKTCRQCGRRGPSEEFVRGRRQCKTCGAAYARARLKNRPEKRALHLGIVNNGRCAKLGLPPVDPHVFGAILLAAERCSYCQHPNDGRLVFGLDHAVPVARGGANDVANLVAACEICNRAKNDLTAEEFRTWLRGVASRLAPMAGSGS